MLADWVDIYIYIYITYILDVLSQQKKKKNGLINVLPLCIRKCSK